MLIDLKQIIAKYNLNIKGVVQVGSHYAEEHQVYVDLGVKNIVYIEPHKGSFNRMISKLHELYGVPQEGALMPLTDEKMYEICSFKSGIKCFQVACADREGEYEMYVSNVNQGQSNSLLEPNLHLRQHPEVVFTEREMVKVVPLDNLSFKKEDYNLLMMDVQGAEGLVLKGAEETLKHIDLIYTEINTGQTYEGNMELPEMDEYLAERGFIRVETFMPSQNWTWGDACFLRRSLLNDFEQISTDLTSI